MGNGKPINLLASQECQAALSRWDTEGGAGINGSQETSTASRPQPEVSAPTPVEFAQLRVRLIALENLVIALLAEASDRQLELAREMAAFISPRPGHTRHHVTIHAAEHMNSIVERAGHFRVRSRT